MNLEEQWVARGRLRRHHTRVKPLDVPDLKDAARFFRLADDPVGFFHGTRDGLFEQHIHAPREGARSVREGRADHGVGNPGLLQKLFRLISRLGQALAQRLATRRERKIYE